MGPLTLDENGAPKPRHDFLLQKVLIDISSAYDFDELPTVTSNDLLRGEPEVLHLLQLVEHLYERYKRLQEELGQDLKTRLLEEQAQHLANVALSCPPHPEYLSSKAHQRYLLIMKSKGHKLEQIIADLLTETADAEASEFLNLRGTASVVTACFKTPLLDTGATTPLKPSDLSPMETSFLHNLYRYAL